ncbi:MAG: hypothetical protein QXX99_07490 [Candidatus Bathyarchaeia archaeon]
MTTEGERGLTFKSVSALLFALIIVQPAIIHLYLVSGMVLPLSTWIVVLIWAEVARLLGKPLTRQELFIIFAFESMALGGSLLFVNLIKNTVFANSPIAEAFGLRGHVPTWWAPPITLWNEVMLRRSFLFQPFFLPVVSLILTLILDIVASISIGYLSYQIYAVTERLTFPAQAASGLTIVAIAERETDSMRVLTVSILFGIIYSVLSYFVPFISGAPTLRLMPRGIFDVTYLIERQFPGVSFAIDLTISTAITGLIIPFNVLVAMLIGSIMVNIGNHYLYVYGIWPEWQPGMPAVNIFVRTQLYYWVSVAIGFSIAATSIPLLFGIRRIIATFKSIGAGSSEAAVPFWLLLTLFFGATLGSTILTHILVPDFPIWISAISSILLSFLFSFVGTASAGITFGGVNIPYLRELMIYSSGYKGLDIWFANYMTWPLVSVGSLPPTGTGLPMISVGGASLAGAFRMARIVGCRISDYIKAYIFVSLAGILTSFLFTSVFWWISPIPSSAFPYTITGWPVEFLERSRFIHWLWTGILFKEGVIIQSLGVGAILSLIAIKILRMPFLPVGLLSGFLTPMSTVLGQFIFGVAGRFMLRKMFGDERWSRFSPLLVIGFIIGDGLILSLSAVISLIIKSQWILPY